MVEKGYELKIMSKSITDLNHHIAYYPQDTEYRKQSNSLRDLVPLKMSWSFQVIRKIVWHAVNVNQETIFKKFQINWHQIRLTPKRIAVQKCPQYEKNLVAKTLIVQHFRYIHLTNRMPAYQFCNREVLVLVPCQMVDGNTFRISVALRVGYDVCVPHQCVSMCGK